MFKYILILLNLIFVSVASAQSLSFEERIKAIDQFVSESDRIQNEIKEFKQELESYSSPKMLKKDSDVLASVLNATSVSEKDVTLADYFVETSRIKKELAELHDVINERETYKKNQKKLKELEYHQAYSKRLNQYIESVKTGKYNQAKALMFTLNDMEKGIAEDYEKTNVYLIREKNMQQSLDQEIVDTKAKIEKSLFFPEESVAKIKKNESLINDQKRIFQQIKDEHALTQYDLKFETWSLGLFNCESKAEYLRPVNFPNMLMLKNAGSLMSVIKLDPSTPNKFDIIYHCKKMGRFGGCLDNEKKELCRLDPSCLGALTEMESAYKRDEYFLSQKSTLPAAVLTERLEMYRDKDKFNFLKAMAESNKLGYFSLDELYSMMTPIIDSSKTLAAKSPEEYYKKIKVEIEKHKKKVMDSIAKKAGAKPSAVKLEETKTSVNYVFTSMITELEVILNDDFIQERTYQGCANTVLTTKLEVVLNEGLLQDPNTQSCSDLEVFCRAGAEWRNKVKVFTGTEEFKNLVPGECPRGVFRLN